MTGASVPPLETRIATPYRNLRPLQWSFSLLWLTFLASWGFLARNEIGRDAPRMVGWIVLGAFINLVPLEGWLSAPFAADDPIVLAGAIVFQPIEASIITFLAAFDPRELRGETLWAKSLWNRSQLSLSWFLGSLAVHAAVPDPGHSTLIVPLAFLVLGVASGVNYSLVGLSIAWERHYRFTDVLSKMRIGLSSDFALVLAAGGVLGAMLVTFYNDIGGWALLAFLVPTLLSRQALGRSQDFVKTSTAYETGQVALEELSRQIDQERADERKLVAADLHDDVLQPLFKVTLLAQVMSAEIPGDLPEVRRDLVGLKSAAEIASNTLRELIGGLRRPGVGRGGLDHAVARLIGVLQEQASVNFHATLNSVVTDSKRQLITYHVAKEALTNAVHHGLPLNVWVDLRVEVDTLILSIRDDGRGFDPNYQKEGHYGLLIMRERASAVGGQLYIDSTPGNGCVVTLLLPATEGDSEGESHET